MAMMPWGSPPPKWKAGTVANSITPSGGTGILVGIGTAAPAQTFHVLGTGTEGVAGSIKIQNTANTNDGSLSFGKSLAEGGSMVGFQGNGYLSGGAGGGYGLKMYAGSSTPRMFIDNLNGGVGIGTTAPATPLDVRHTTAGNGSSLRLQNNSVSGYTELGLYSSAGTSVAGLGYGNASAAYSPGGAYFYTAAKNFSFSLDSGGTTALYLQASNNNVGIGTTGPAQLLDVRGSVQIKRSTAANLMYFHDATNGWIGSLSHNSSGGISIEGGAAGAPYTESIAIGTTTNTIKLTTNSAVAMTIDSAGKVGIGIATPDTPLHVWKATAGVVTALANTVLTLESDTHAYLNFLVPSGSAAGLIIGQGTNNSYASFTYNRNFADQWDITTNVAGATSALKIQNSNNSNTSSNALLGVQVGGASAGDPYITYTINTVVAWSTGVDNSDSDKFKFSSGGAPGSTDLMTIDTTGNVGIGTTTIGTNNRLIVNAYSTVDNLATAQVNTNAATNKGLVVQGFASQSADLQQWQDSTAAVLSRFDATGRLGLGIAPTSTLHVTGSNARSIASVSADTTLSASHYTVLVDASGGAKVITLPAASGCSGRVYNVKKIDSSGNTVTLDGNASETIDGATTLAMTVQYESLSIQCDGTGWYII